VFDEKVKLGPGDFILLPRETGLDVGYQSEAAFSRAYKAWLKLATKERKPSFVRPT
jgi:hypothetical protein